MKASAGLAFLAATVFCAGIAVAQPRPSAQSLRSSLAGEWTGALGYRDYQSNKLIELPVRTWVENVPDGVTQYRRSVFDEGAGRAPVWIASLSQWKADGRLTNAILRAGRDPEQFDETAEVTSHSGLDRWVVILRRTGLDDDKPADIRVTETRDGETLLSVKEVRPAGQDSAPWQFRNQTRLQRVGTR